MICIRELQQPGIAYAPTPLIQQIPHLIRYKKGEPADAHELLIAMINDISTPILKIFQGQMASTVQCARCDRVTTTTAHIQDIALHVDEDSHTPLGERLLHFFQPETLEGENSYWCDTCIRPCRATQTLSYTHVPTILIIHLKRLILGRKIQAHVPFDTILDMKPYLAPEHTSTIIMELIGIITHQGTKEQGHYVTITRKGNERISYNDAIVTQVTMTELLQTQAYILIYRKKDHGEGTGTHGPSNSTTIQNSITKKPKLSHKEEYRPVESLPPGPQGKSPEQNIPCQQESSGGDTPQPSPIYGEGLLEESQMRLDFFPTTRPDPQAPATRREGEEGGTELPEKDPTFEIANHLPPDAAELGPTGEVRLDQSENVTTNFPQTIMTFHTPDTTEEGAGVGAEVLGGDPTLQLAPVDPERAHLENEKTPEQNTSYLQKPIGGDTPQPSPVYGEGLWKANLRIMDILPTNCPDLQVLETRGEGEAAEAEEPGEDPLLEQVQNSPTVDLEPGYLEDENTNFPQTMLTLLQLSQGRVEELTSLLSELSGTPLTTETTCKWLGLDSQSKAIPTTITPNLSMASPKTPKIIR